jgi:hypothetical protein
LIDIQARLAGEFKSPVTSFFRARPSNYGNWSLTLANRFNIPHLL